MSSGRFVELSHAIDAGMVTYAGLPGPVVSEFLTREASRANYSGGTTFSIGRVEMVANTGTYVDAPFHRFGDGPDVADLPLENLADLEGIVVDASAAGRGIDAGLFGRGDFAGVGGSGLHLPLCCKTLIPRDFRGQTGIGPPFARGTRQNVTAAVVR